MVTGARQRRVGFHTFGCKLNHFETDALASSLRGQGFSIVAAAEQADIYIINTCTVTARADHKARSFIRQLSRIRPEATLFVTGCSAQVEAARLSAIAPSVVVIPQAEKSRLLDLPRLLLDTRDRRGGGLSRGSRAGMTADDPFQFLVEGNGFRTRTFLKIQDGCDSRCSYCRVPQARGASVSLEAAEVIRRAQDLESRGHREIIITGANISTYRSGATSLNGLLRSLLDSTLHARFRLSSLEPEAITEDLAGVLAHERICPHFHIPIQSGSDSVLTRMKRRYGTDTVRHGVGLLRSVRSNPFIAADIIVGFPGETQDEFAQTRRLVESLALSALHVFPYSPRPGTAATGMRPTVPERLRSERAQALSDLSRELSSAYAKSWVGKDLEAILEEYEGSQARAVAGNYLKMRVSGLPDGADYRGRLALARITSAGPTCQARFLAFSG